MDSSFLTLPPPYEKHPCPPSPTLSDHSRGRRGRSPSFLTSVKNAMQQPLRRMRSPQRSPVLSPGLSMPPQSTSLSDNWVPRGDSRPRPTSSRRSHCGYHTGSCELSCHACHRPLASTGRGKREPIPSMADYLTLSQLEVVWRTQDTYKGCVDTPRTANSEALDPTERRSRSANNESVYRASSRVPMNYSRPRQSRSQDGISRWESYGNRPHDITEYYGKK